VGPWLREVGQPLGYRAIEAAEVFAPEKVYNVRRTKEGGLDFGIDGQVCHISPKLLSLAAEEIGAIDGFNAHLIGPDRFVVVLHTSRCGRSIMFCVDRADSAEVWRAVVWGERNVVPFSTGTGLVHWVDIQVATNDIQVFGCGGSSMYLEVFAAIDGKAVYRFSTSY
jgi:hypothetical protein